MHGAETLTTYTKENLASAPVMVPKGKKAMLRFHGLNSKDGIRLWFNSSERLSVQEFSINYAKRQQAWRSSQRYSRKFHLTMSLWWHPFSASLHTSLSLSLQLARVCIHLPAGQTCTCMCACPNRNAGLAECVRARARGGKTSICLSELTQSAHRLRGNAHANQDL